VPREHKELKETLGHKELLVLKAQQVLRELLVLKVTKVPRARKEIRVQLEPLAQVSL
jgi:hypothetical protein